MLEDKWMDYLPPMVEIHNLRSFQQRRSNMRPYTQARQVFGSLIRTEQTLDGKKFPEHNVGIL